MNVKDQNELQAMCICLLIHTVQMVQFQSTIEMMDRIDVLDLHMLSTYDQDDLQVYFGVGSHDIVIISLLLHLLQSSINHPYFLQQIV
jgi:hypothetical protein